MAFQTGPISASALASYYGVPRPLNLGKMYRGGGYVPNTPQNAHVPTGGTLRYSDFRNSYVWPFDITTVVSQAQNLVNSVPGGIIMPPYSGNDHWASFYWNGSGWVFTGGDSYGGGDAWGNTMRPIFPSFFSFFNQITGGGSVLTGNYQNLLWDGTKYVNIEGFWVAGTRYTGYTNSDQMTFDYLNAILHAMQGAFRNIQSGLDGINFGGSRAQFMAGMQQYQNWLYAN